MFQVPAYLKTNSREIDFHHATSNNSNVLITRATQGAGAGAPRSRMQMNLPRSGRKEVTAAGLQKPSLGMAQDHPPFGIGVKFQQAEILIQFLGRSPGPPSLEPSPNWEVTGRHCSTTRQAACRLAKRSRLTVRKAQ